jgi:predicted nucleotidyltransferase
MQRPGNVRSQMLTATIPFLMAVASLSGVQRIALIGSLVTEKADPKDVDILLSVEDAMDLVDLAAHGRQLQGRVTSLTHSNVGVDLFVADSRHRYLGRLCSHKGCPGYRRSCTALHCGRRPYLRDDLRSVTLERTLVVAPPLHLWPTIITRVRVPGDVERYLLHPLITRLGLERTEQIIPRSVREQSIRRDGTIDQVVLAALREAAAFLEVTLTEDVVCGFIEIHPLEHFAPMLHFPETRLHLDRLWVVELAGRTCFVFRGCQEGAVVFIAR